MVLVRAKATLKGPPAMFRGCSRNAGVRPKERAGPCGGKQQNKLAKLVLSWWFSRANLGGRRSGGRSYLMTKLVKLVRGDNFSLCASASADNRGSFLKLRLTQLTQLKRHAIKKLTVSWFAPQVDFADLVPPRTKIFPRRGRADAYASLMARYFPTFSHLLAYRDEQVEMLRAGQITDRQFRDRIRRATRTFNTTYRRPTRTGENDAREARSGD